MKQDGASRQLRNENSRRLKAIFKIHGLPPFVLEKVAECQRSVFPVAHSCHSSRPDLDSCAATHANCLSCGLRHSSPRTVARPHVKNAYQRPGLGGGNVHCSRRKRKEKE
ncbi:hypothetical protein C0Q70_05105 [Pomacea canaliculata]|uniref:Uncharacterized protein n=1 Tax=Pomacea canaliculata TaxID=400727 RepID=A0A2T7PKB8_POMCA|nr:hypothetical protein C0Q70_05105 [Pomacea canaliculata]